MHKVHKFKEKGLSVASITKECPESVKVGIERRVSTYL